MNNKEQMLQRLVDIALKCCATEIDEGEMSVTRDHLLKGSRKQNVVMTRCVLVSLIAKMGYSTQTASQLLHMSECAVRNLQAEALMWHAQSYAYRVAEREAYAMVDKMMIEA